MGVNCTRSVVQKLQQLQYASVVSLFLEPYKFISFHWIHRHISTNVEGYQKFKYCMEIHLFLFLFQRIYRTSLISLGCLLCLWAFFVPTKFRRLWFKCTWTIWASVSQFNDPLEGVFNLCENSRKKWFWIKFYPYMEASMKTNNFFLVLCKCINNIDWLWFIVCYSIYLLSLVSV